MADTTTPSAEQTTQPTSTTTAAPAEPTLDDVYRETFPAQPAAAPAQLQQPAQVAPTPQVDLPDLYDPDKLKSWLQSQAQRESALTHAVGMLSQQQATQQAQQSQQKLRQEIDSAVDRANQTLQLPDANKKLIEYALEEKARTDPRFRQLWDNRGLNPLAWDKALSAVSREMAPRFNVRLDAQVAADRQALRQSQQHQATGRVEETQEPAWHNASTNTPEFALNWERMRQGN